MRINKIILSFLVLSLILFNGISQKAQAVNPMNASLVFADTDQGPPTDEITTKYDTDLVQEVIIGRTVAYALLNKYDNKVNTDPDLNRYVNLVGQSIAKAASNRPQVTYKFGIIETDDINAFACPGGYVFITSGLLKTLYDENELAAVLAHEIGHIEHGDGLRDIKNHKSDKYAKLKVDEIGKDVAIAHDVARSMPYYGWYASYYSPKNMAKRGLGRAIGHIGGGYGGYVARSIAYDAADIAVDASVDGLKKAAKKIGTAMIKSWYEDPLDPQIEFDADAFSAEALAKAGYDPKGINGFLKTVQHVKSSQSAQGAQAATQGASGSSMFTYRHPPIEERITHVDILVDEGNITAKNPKAGEDAFFEERYAQKLKLE